VSQALVAHTYNPSYSGGRDQEDCGLKPAGQIVHETLFKKTHHKHRTGGVVQGEGPEFKLQNCKKKKKIKGESLALRITASLSIIM
jgi:hypothetical protein